MSVNDPRVKWMQQRVCSSFHNVGPSCFEELLSRDNGENEQLILYYLNETSLEESPSVLYFFKAMWEEEVEVQVVVGFSHSNGETQKEETHSISDFASEGCCLIQEMQAPEIAISDPDGKRYSAAASPALSSLMMGVSIEHSEAEISPVIKMEIHKVQHIKLYVSQNHIPEKCKDLPTIYFLRDRNEAINPVCCSEDMEEVLPKFIEMGYMNNDLLMILNNLMNFVFIPLFSARQQHIRAQQATFYEINLKEKGNLKRPILSQSSYPIKDKLLASSYKWYGQIQFAIHCLEGEIKLYVPEFNVNGEITYIASNQALTEILKQSMRKWQSQIASVIEEQKKTKPEELGLLQEMQFWHEWSITLRVLDEQLNGCAVKKIIDVLMLVDPAAVQKFNLSWDMLKKYQMNAADNFKFLVTLKHPFKNIDSGFFGIHDIIPQIMNRLKIIWIVSNHFNDHERMMSIMLRIEGKLSNSVARVIDIHALFKQNRETAMTILLQGKHILEGWKASYLKVCGDIENVHRYSLWTFDRQQLFERTDYMALICQDLHKILQTYEQLYSTFNTSLRKLIGKPKRLNELSLWTESLIKPIEELNFNPFKLQEKNSWEKVMEKFENEVKEIEAEVIEFLDLSFKSAHSAEAAFDMLLNFKYNHSRPAVRSQLRKKHNEILVKYAQEIDTISNMFEQNRDNPFLSKNNPPVAGSIVWEKSLFRHLKHTIFRLMEDKEIMNTDQGKEVRSMYIQIGIQMRQYEVAQYLKWHETAEQFIPSLLTQSLLLKYKTSKTEDVSDDMFISVKTELDLKNIQYTINFSPEVKEIILEAKYMDLLGFSVPELVRHVALQENKFYRDIYRLKNMLKRFHSLMNLINDVECYLLDGHVQDLQSVLQYGCKRLNWFSLGISNYIDRCMKAIAKFKRLLNQVKKNAQDIENKLLIIESANLFEYPVPQNNTSLFGIEDFFKYVKEERAKEVAYLCRKYKAISPLLIKIESLVLNTDSGKAPKMEKYYTHWEYKVYNALTTMIVKNIHSFSANLMKKGPLFQVETSVSPSDITLYPNALEIYDLTMQCFTDCLDTSKFFIRWMRGTCIMCPPQKVKGQDKTFLFSFFKDVAQVPQVKEQAVILSQNIHYVLTSITKQVNKWKKYMHRCKFDKDIYMKKSVADLLSHLAYNDKMQLYSNIIQEAEHLPLMNMVLCVQLNMETTVQTFREKAKECIQVLGKQLSISVMEDLHKLEGKLQKLSEKLKIQDKSVLTKKAYSPLIIEKTFEDIREKHRILAVYNINVSEEEKVLCSKLKQLWDALFQDLKNFRKQEEDLPRFTESSKQLDQHREEAVLADPQFISAATGDEEVPMK